MLYHVGTGPLTALKRLLVNPLEFDAQDFVKRTVQIPHRHDFAALMELVELFESTKKNLLLRVTEIPLVLSAHKKLDDSNYNDHKSPITWSITGGENIDSIGAALKVQKIDGLNLQVDRMLESFNVFECFGESSNVDKLSDFIAFYYLSEVLFFAFCEIGHVQKIEGELIVGPNGQNSVNSLHRKWFGNFWESCSSQANIAYIDILPSDAIRQPDFFVLIDLMGKGLRDKIFSIPAKDYSDRLENSVSVEWMGKVCAIVALCLWCQLKAKMDHVPVEITRKIGVDVNDLARLLALQRQLPEPDRIFRFREEGIKLVNPSFTHQLRESINNLCAVLSEGNLNQILGDYFEKDYLRNYFEKRLNEEQEIYRVHDGILKDQLPDPKNKVDVDFIIEDLRRGRFLFVQVKYLRIGGKAYILGDVEHFVAGKLTKGLVQIEAARQAHGDGMFNELLRERGITNCHSSNSTFLLVHNISNFDFQITSSGVCVYEWNTLRNLLQDGRCVFGNSKNVPGEWKYSRPLPIEDPDQVIQILMENSPVCKTGGGDRLFETDYIISSVKIDGKTVKCIGMGI